MDIRKLQRIVVEALEDIKGKDIEVINTTKLTSLFDRLVIATGDSNRQVKALARNVQEKVKEAGGEVIALLDGRDCIERVARQHVRAECEPVRPGVHVPPRDQRYVYSPRLRRLFGRARLEKEEINLLRGILKSIRR